MLLTDTLALLLDAGQPLFACEFQGKRFDTGRPLGLLEASISLALAPARHRPRPQAVPPLPFPELSFMRTLVLGIPLPNATFDNYSFLSAPSFFDYGRLIVEHVRPVRRVEEVDSRATEHTTHGGQAIVNGPGGPAAFSLAELLGCAAARPSGCSPAAASSPASPTPMSATTAIRELPGWRSYDWLPAPEGFSYGEHLLAGFGSSALSSPTRSTPSRRTSSSLGLG